ncbi:MAG: sigma-54-dependent Fis family transcriptional regulator [Gemmatimonadales bacterium]|nr:sigma-54-dependent Fis family transcriptional regulator [Gemmatimonadales bacterium]
MPTILVADDDPAIAALLEDVLVQAGHSVLVATSGGEALAFIEREPIDLILADYQMPRMTGLDLIAALSERGRRIPVVIITAYSSVEHAVFSMRSGAVDYIAKPVRTDMLEITISHALEFSRLRAENEAFKHELSRIRTRRSIVGSSAPLRQVLETISSVAPSRATVLLEGESGTGKEIFARAIHDQSPRRDRAFVSVNCAALPEGLVESVLFGHEKGAFTGATARSPGAFERADGGTLLLDEVSEMRLDLQSKLLRAIQEQEIERVGGRETIRVDVRIIATTNRELKAEVDAGRFRADLFYRLHVMPIRTPPLRDRLDDIPLLANHFARVAAERLGVEATLPNPEAIALLQQYLWPGNVRELSNAMERAVILSNGHALGPELFRPWLFDSASSARSIEPLAVSGRPAEDLSETATLNLSDLERYAIQRALRETGGNRTRAARLLGMSERTLRSRLNTPPSQSA